MHKGLLELYIIFDQITLFPYSNPHIIYSVKVAISVSTMKKLYLHKCLPTNELVYSYVWPDIYWNKNENTPRNIKRRKEKQGAYSYLYTCPRVEDSCIFYDL